MKHFRRRAVASIAMLAIVWGLTGAARTYAGEGNQGNQGNQGGQGDGGHGGRDDSQRIHTATPIKHVIVLIGENWTFDSIFATYQPQNKQSVDNLLSRGIVTASGAPGPNFDYSQ